MSTRGGYNITDQHATYFLTLTVVGWVDLFTRKDLCDIIIESLEYCKEKKGLILNAYVIMSSHIHLVASVNKPYDGMSAFLRDFKRHTSKQIVKYIERSHYESRKDWLKVVLKYNAKFDKNNWNYKVWQRSNHPKILLTPNFTKHKINYIHKNPVAAGLVKKAEHFVYSSASNYAGFQENKIEVSTFSFESTEGFICNL